MKRDENARKGEKAMMMLEDLIAQNPALFKKEYNHFYRRGSYLLHQGEPLQSLFFAS